MTAILVAESLFFSSFAYNTVYCLDATPRHVTKTIHGYIYWPYFINFCTCMNSGCRADMMLHRRIMYILVSHCAVTSLIAYNYSKSYLWFPTWMYSSCHGPFVTVAEHLSVTQQYKWSYEPIQTVSMVNNWAVCVQVFKQHILSILY